MNNERLITVIAAGAFLVLYIIYLLLKIRLLSSLNKEFANNKFDKVIEKCEKDLYLKIVGEFNCDLYALKAYACKNDIEILKEKLNYVLDKQYSQEKQEKLLEYFYHYFLNLDESEYTEKLLDDVHKLGDASFTKYNDWAYEVIKNGRNDFTDEMDFALQNKEFKGFALGTVVYLMALQFERENRLEEAGELYLTATQCFLPNAYYMPKAKYKVEELGRKL